MNIYYRYDTKKLCDSQGNEIYNTTYYPQFPCQSLVSVNFYFLQLNIATGLIEPADVSSVTAWSFAIADDWASDTEVMSRVIAADIDASDADVGLLVMSVDTNTTGFLTAVDGLESLNCYAQLKAFDSTPKKIDSYEFRIIANGDIDLGVDPPTAEQTNYYSKTEWLALLGAIIGVATGSPDDADGLNGYIYINSTTGDFYQKAGGTWGTKKLTVTGAAGTDGADGTNGTNGTDGDDAYIYIAYASDSSGTGFTLTFNPDLDYIAIKHTTTAIASPAVGDFTGMFKKYKGEAGSPGADGTGYTPTGAWVSGTNYAVNDTATYTGSLYNCIVAVTDNSTDSPAVNTTCWEVLVSKGDTGDGDTISPATNTANYVPQWDGADSKTLKNGLPVGGASGIASLDASSKVVENPANATDTPTATKIPISSATGKLDGWITDASTTAKGKVELAIASEVTTGTSNTIAVTPDALAGSDYGKRVVQVQLNDSTALTTSAKAYFRVPSCMNGWNLVGVAAMCVGASSSGTVTFTVKNGATSMLSTNLTIDATETDSSTATAAVIDTAEDDIATSNQIEVACSGAGTGVTYAVVELTFQLP